ncbi:MAG: heparan-alpha-glucosaminide N-acetyltransferase [Desulfosporosinus sp.]
MNRDSDSLNREITNRRHGEIDVLRAVAIVLMVLFHLIYDLKEFAGVSIDYQSPLWFIIGKASALLFMFISGISSGFSRSPVRRGLKVLFYGMGITVVTYLFMKDGYVRFGILHFLGVTMILSPLLVRLSSWTLWGLACSSAVIGFWFKEQVLRTSLLLPFGLKYDGFGSMDYYPLFPYLAVTLLGILAYRHFYARRTEPLLPFRLNSKLIKWLSQNSLGIYLFHQPLLLLMIFSINRLEVFNNIIKP